MIIGTTLTSFSAILRVLQIRFRRDGAGPNVEQRPADVMRQTGPTRLAQHRTRYRCSGFLLALVLVAVEILLAASSLASFRKLGHGAVYKSIELVMHNITFDRNGLQGTRATQEVLGQIRGHPALTLIASLYRVQVGEGTPNMLVRGLSKDIPAGIYLGDIHSSDNTDTLLIVTEWKGRRSFHQMYVNPSAGTAGRDIRLRYRMEKDKYINVNRTVCYENGTLKNDKTDVRSQTNSTCEVEAAESLFQEILAKGSFELTNQGENDGVVLDYDADDVPFLMSVGAATCMTTLAIMINCNRNVGRRFVSKLLDYHISRLFADSSTSPAVNTTSGDEVRISLIPEMQLLPAEWLCEGLEDEGQANVLSLSVPALDGLQAKYDEAVLRKCKDRLEMLQNWVTNAAEDPELESVTEQQFIAAPTDAVRSLLNSRTVDGDVKDQVVSRLKVTAKAAITKRRLNDSPEIRTWAEYIAHVEPQHDEVV